MTMKKKILTTLSILFGLLLILQFNNCDPYAEEAGDDPSEETTQTAAEIGIKMNLDLSTTPINAGIFEVGGECNVGTNPAAEVMWEIRVGSSSGPILFSSRQVMEISQDSRYRPVVKRCEDGRFFLKVILPDNTSGAQYGLFDDQEYFLKFVIYGLDASGSPNSDTAFKVYSFVTSQLML